MLPRYLYRVTHKSFAGKVFKDNEGTHFVSQYAAVHEQDHLSDLKLYDHGTLVNFLKNHVNCWQFLNGIRYDSHFISTTDSFEHAVTWARRFRKDGRVTIHAIDLWRPGRPALIINMAHPMRAWNLKADMVDWRYKMYIYGAETEWIILDHLVAQDAIEIDFKSFTHSTIRSEGSSLFNIVRRLKHGEVQVAVQDASTSIDEEQKAMNKFQNKDWIKKFAPIPPVLPCIRSDRRVKFDHHAANRIYDLVKEIRDPFKNEIFMYLASVMGKTDYYYDPIISEVSSFFPLVVQSHLHHVKDPEKDLESELLAFYRPESGTTGRKDMSEYYQLVEDIIRAWVRHIQDTTTTVWRDLPVYIIRDGSSSSSNFLGLKTLSMQGKGEITSPSISFQATELPPSTFPFLYREVLERGMLIQKDLTDAEYASRNIILYKDIFHIVAE